MKQSELYEAILKRLDADSALIKKQSATIDTLRARLGLDPEATEKSLFRPADLKAATIVGKPHPIPAGASDTTHLLFAGDTPEVIEKKRKGRASTLNFGLETPEQEAARKERGKKIRADIFKESG